MGRDQMENCVSPPALCLPYACCSFLHTEPGDTRRHPVCSWPLLHGCSSSGAQPNEQRVVEEIFQHSANHGGWKWRSKESSHRSIKQLTGSHESSLRHSELPGRKSKISSLSLYFHFRFCGSVLWMQRSYD